MVSVLEKHYGPSHGASTPEPRRGNPDTIRRDLGANLDDSLFETGGSKMHIAPMPTQAMSILHAERHERQEISRRHFAQEKDRFEQTRREELDRMNQEFENMAQKLAEMKVQEQELEQRTVIKQANLQHVTGELSNLEDKYSYEHARLKRETTALEDKQENSLRDSKELHGQLEDITKRMLAEQSALTLDMDDLQHAKARLERQQAEQHRRDAQKGFGNVNGGVCGSSSGTNLEDGTRSKKVTISDPNDADGTGSGRWTDHYQVPVPKHPAPVGMHPPRI